MEDYINEQLLEKYPSYVSIEQTKIILEQLENSICKIFSNNGKRGTGFFCNINFKKSNKSFPALITNNHILDEKAIKPDNIFKISYYQNKKLEYMDINIGKNRLVYTSKKYDTTIIELKDEKNKINKFLDIDQRIFQDNSNLLYFGKTAYVLHFPGDKSASVSYGLIEKSEESNYQMKHFCSTENGSSGGPIFSLSEMKVIGIHKGRHLNFNRGFFLKYSIEEFEIENMKINCYRPMNEIDIEYHKCMLEIIGKFKKEEIKWLESINEPKIQNRIQNIKKKLEKLFDLLFENEKIMDKINNKFSFTIKAPINTKELELKKMNFIVIGTSGVGKSTLINEIFGEKLAKEGMGTRATLESKKYESKLVPFLSVLDTPGNEINNGHRLIDVLQETLEQITQKLNSNDINEHIHCILFCTTSNRFTLDELDVILKLRDKYDEKKLPIVIVYTRATRNDEVENTRKEIQEFLSKHGKNLSNDNFGITFIPINVREEEKEILGVKVISPSFGLSALMSTCFIKCEKSYRILIKSTLIQICKNKIRDYINNISEQLANNLKYYYYLNQKFEPNFSNYISYCFEKLTDVEKQEGISNNEINSLENYNNNIKQKQIENKDQVLVNLCSLCYKKTEVPYICGFCKALVCENCYLNQFSQKDIPRCALCDQELVENKLNKNNNSHKINPDNINNYMNILKTNLNSKSRNSIFKFIEVFSNELIDEVNERFENFTKDEFEKLYTKLLEKYIENINNVQNISKLKESMKSKTELKSEFIETLTNVLKEGVIEEFLKKNASEIYKSVVEIFKGKLNTKLDEFINNIENNKEINKIWESYEINKQIKIQENITNYIRKLQKNEEESQKKYIIEAYGKNQI